MSEAVLDTTEVREWKRYPSFRPVDSDWLPAVPTHWEFDRLKWTIVSCQNGIWGDDPTGLPDDDIGCVRVADFDRNNHVVNDSIELTQRSVPKSKRMGRELRRGDLLLEKSGGGDLQPVGAVVLFDSDTPAVCSNFVARVSVADGYCSSYLRYLHAGLYFGRLNTRSMKQSTGIQNLDSSQYLDEKVGLPPLSEQRAIAAFLDRETARIDALIGHKQRLIALLEEKRQAVISHAVTKGLDPNAKMKDSGVSSIGFVPRDWLLTRLKFVTTKTGSGKTPKGGGDVYQNEGVLFLRSQNVHFDGLRTDDCVFIAEDVDAEMSNSRVQPNDVLLNITGASLGRCCLVPTNVECANVNQHVCIIRPLRSKVDPGFLNALLSSACMQDQIFSSEDGISREGLNFNQINNMFICIPPNVEQQLEIVTFTEQKTQVMHQLKQNVVKSIARLQEYRTALISAAVTGQIDVREEVQLDD